MSINLSNILKYNNSILKYEIIDLFITLYYIIP